MMMMAVSPLASGSNTSAGVNSNSGEGNQRVSVNSGAGGGGVGRKAARSAGGGGRRAKLQAVNTSHCRPKRAASPPPPCTPRVNPGCRHPSTATTTTPSPPATTSPPPTRSRAKTNNLIPEYTPPPTPSNRRGGGGGGGGLFGLGKSTIKSPSPSPPTAKRRHYDNNIHDVGVTPTNRLNSTKISTKMVC